MGTSFSYSLLPTSDNTQKIVTKEKLANEAYEKMECLTRDKVAQLLKTKKEEEKMKVEKKAEEFYEKFLKYVDQNKLAIRKNLEDSVKECTDDNKYFAITSTELSFKWEAHKIRTKHWNQLREILKLSTNRDEITLGVSSLCSSHTEIVIKYLGPCPVLPENQTTKGEP